MNNIDYMKGRYLNNYYDILYDTTVLYETVSTRDNLPYDHSDYLYFKHKVNSQETKMNIQMMRLYECYIDIDDTIIKNKKEKLYLFD